MIKKGIVSILALSLLFAGLTSCINTSEPMPPEDGISLVIVIGRHANANLFTPATLNAEVQNLIRRAFSLGTTDEGRYYAQGRIDVVTVEGTPTIRHIPPQFLSGEWMNPEYRTRQVDNMVNNILNYLISPELRATTEETRLLEAIGMAAIHLEAMPESEETERHILILGSGLSTEGIFDMTINHIQDGNPAEVVARIPSGGVPDLYGINISFFGLGNAAGPQINNFPNLFANADFHRQLEGIWTEIFTEAGATLTQPIAFTNPVGNPMLWDEYDPHGTDGGYPRVSVIPLREIILERPVFEVEIEIEEFVETWEPVAFVFEAAQLDFIANSTHFRNAALSERLIHDAVTRYQGIAEYLNAHTDMRIFVVGSIARTTPGSSSRSSTISAGRAQNVANVLRHFRIPDERIVVIDAGTHPFSWRNHNEFPDGVNVNRENQQRNRVVAIIPEGNAEGLSRYFIELRDAGFVN
jgi:hypothetical protein